MTTFDKAVQIILAREGAHSFDNAGGDTVWGIAKNFHPEVFPWPPTREQAIEIYRSEYWTKFRCGEFPELISIALFDGVVNQDQHAVIAELQRSLHVDPDGIVGPATIAAAQQADPAEVTALFYARRAIRYATVSLSEFRLGLIARLFRVQHAILTAQA